MNENPTVWTPIVISMPPWRIGLAGLRRKLHQAICGLTGHDRYLHVEAHRLTMRCVLCNHDSPGWDTGGEHYHRTYNGDTRHQLK